MHNFLLSIDWHLKGRGRNPVSRALLLPKHPPQCKQFSDCVNSVLVFGQQQFGSCSLLGLENNLFLWKVTESPITEIAVTIYSSYWEYINVQTLMQKEEKTQNHTKMTGISWGRAALTCTGLGTMPWSWIQKFQASHCHPAADVSHPLPLWVCHLNTQLGLDIHMLQESSGKIIT